MTLTTRVTGLSALLLLVAFIAQPCAQQGATYTNRLRFNASAQTVASNGGATAATGTVTLGKSYVELTCSDTDGCTMSLSETGAHSGDVLVIVNVSANTETFADSAGVLELNGGTSASLAQYDSLSVVYRSDRWVQVSRTSLLMAGVQLVATTCTLTDAQIKTLPTAIVSCISAPGSGKRVIPIKGQWRVNATAGAYTNINGSAKVRLVYGASVAPASYELLESAGEVTALIGAAAIRSVPLHYWESTAIVTSSVENVAVSVSIDNNGGGNLTGGNAANSMVVSFMYLVIG